MCHSGHSLNSVLYEAYQQCAGEWKSSKFYLMVRERHRSTKRGTRKWLMAAEMDNLFGPEVAAAMRERKLTEPALLETEVRFHPELPQKEAGNVVLHIRSNCYYISRYYSRYL